ncbi:polynucleotide kinase-phosphatase, partial [Clavibacter michiganensis subsp. insidiosus]
MTDAPAPAALPLPRMSLVLLVGASGSGKSTFARTHFGPYEVLSSDVFRGLVSNDENDQSATSAAFEALRHVAAHRLRRGLMTVIDATNVQPESRRSLVQLARDHDVLPVAIVLDVPVGVCVERNAARTDRTFGASVVKRQHDQLQRSLKGLGREGFRKAHVLRGVEEVAAARFTVEPLLNDLRHERGPFDAIGDVHGCRAELETLLGELGYEIQRDERGRPVDAAHPAGRRAVFLGDLVDRGPDTPGVLRLVMGMVRAGHAFAVPGNHEDKLVKALQGKKVRVAYGLAESLAQLAEEDEAFRVDVERFCRELVSHLVLDGGDLVVAHAGLIEAYQGRASGRVRAFALWGDATIGETDEHGLPVRRDWALDYRGSATVLYGHVAGVSTEWVNGTLCLDTGCVFGGELTALRWPEREVVSVSAERVWSEPAVPLGRRYASSAAAGSAA